MTTRSMIYDFLHDNGSDPETSSRNSGIVMELLHDNRPIVYEMLEDILQSDNLGRASADKDLLQELLFICPSLEHMPRVLSSVVLMVNEKGVIDPDTANQLILIDRALAERKTRIAKLEKDERFYAFAKDLCADFDDTPWDKLLSRERGVFGNEETYLEFRRWAQK